MLSSPIVENRSEDGSTARESTCPAFPRLSAEEWGELTRETSSQEVVIGLHCQNFR